jgi:hypothetical protein
MCTFAKTLFKQTEVDAMITIFCDFCQYSAEKLYFFLKNQCYDKIFGKI